MGLLKYEYIDSSKGSFNGILGELVKKVRHYHNNVSVDEFKSVLPILKSIEAQLQMLDKKIGNEKRFYLEEIMSELTEENEIEENLLEEIKEKTIVALELFSKLEFQIDILSYEFKKHKGVYLIIFNDNGHIGNEELLVIKEVFRAVCYKYNVIFIDIFK